MHKILIVEDDEDLLRGLVINLSREGYEIVQADRGDLGLELALKTRPHLVLLDVMLPEVDGYYFLNKGLFINKDNNCRGKILLIY